MAINYLAIESA